MLDLDIPEEEGRIKDKNPEDIVVQVLDLAKDYACILLFRKNPFLKLFIFSYGKMEYYKHS